MYYMRFHILLARGHKLKYSKQQNVTDGAPGREQGRKVRVTAWKVNIDQKTELRSNPMDQYNRIALKKNISVVDVAESLLTEFAEILQKNENVAKTALDELQKFIESDYKTNKNNPREKVKDCCTYKKDLKWNNLFQAEVNLFDVCESFLNRTDCKGSNIPVDKIHILEGDAIQKFRTAHEKLLHRARHSYYGAEDGYFIQYPAQNFMGENHCICSAFDGRLRPWYVGAISPKIGKDIVLAIDISSTMKSVISKLYEVVNVLLKTFDSNDQIKVFTYQDGQGGDDRLDCESNLVRVTPAVISKISSTIQQLNSSDFTGAFSYTSAIQDSYRFLKDSSRTKVLFIVTGGKDGKDEHAEITRVIDEEAHKVNCSVALKLLIVTESGLDSKQHGKQIQYLEKARSCPGSSSQEVDNALVQFFPQDNEIRTKLGNIVTSLSGDVVEGTVHFSMPYIDVNGLGTAIDACRRCSVDGKIVGVACIMFLQEELFGLTHHSFVQREDLYTFLIDDTGTTYVHPKLPKLTETYDAAFPLDIRTFETSKQFETIYDSMLHAEDDKLYRKVIYENISASTGSSGTKFMEKNMTYVWKKIEHSPFSIAVVISNDYEEVGINLDRTESYANETYHRLDLYNMNEKICTVKDSPATTDSSVLKLSNTVFEHPKSYFKDENIEEIRNLMDYMQKKSNFSEPIKNLDLALKIRGNVLATSVLNNFWKNTSQSENYYAIWRYVATEDGTTRTYPGTRIHPYYDPRVRPWYKLAEASAGKLAVTEPYIDGWTGTTLITLTKAIYTSTQSRKVLAGVMGIDISVSYIQLVLADRVLDCKSETSQFMCVVLDQMGYIIYHPDFLGGNVTKTHIIEKEAATARIMINNGHMMKKFCLGYHKTVESLHSNIAHVEWFYTLDNVIKTEIGKTSADDCPYYELTPVSEMNILVLKIKKKCSSSELPDKCACPKDASKTCSVSKVTDLKICECPCYQYRVCLDKLPPLTTSLVCEPPIKQLNITENLYTTKWLDKVKKLRLPDCLDPKCNFSETQRSCNRLGCEWCYIYKNETILNDEDKHCNYEGKCFPEETTTISPTTMTNKSSDDGLGAAVIIVIVVCLIIVVLFIAGFVKWSFRRNACPPVNDTVKYPQPDVVNAAYYPEEDTFQA